MSAMQYTGGAVVAMVGKDCVAICSDKRFGQQGLTIGTEFPKVFEMQEKLYLGLAGLATDVTTLAAKFRMKLSMYHLDEGKEIGAEKFAQLVSSTLYESRFSPLFCEPVVAGLDIKKDGTVAPFIASTDTIGCINFAKDFVVCGVTGPELYGMCESLWEPNLEPEDLFETISQAMLNALDRDALSGWGAVVHIITADKVITRQLKGRMD